MAYGVRLAVFTTVYFVSLTPAILIIEHGRRKWAGVVYPLLLIAIAACVWILWSYK